MTGWRPHSGTWENADYFRRYWKNHKNIDVYNKSIAGSNLTSLNNYLYNNYWSGDIIQYASGGVSEHSTIVVGQTSYNGKNTLRMAQHTAGNDNIPLLQYLNMTGYENVRAFKFNSWK